MRRLLLTCLLLSTLAASAAPGHGKILPQVGALVTDCALSGAHGKSENYQFVATCAGRARSPNNRFSIVQRAYRDEQPPIELQDARGRTIARLPTISDDMPFTVAWSPDSRWIAINHHVGSFMDELHLFRLIGNRLVEQPVLIHAAKRLATRRYRCLSRDAVLPNFIRWAKDGHSLVMVTISSLYACNDEARQGDWQPLWMIGAVRTGQIDPSSVREDAGDGPLREPRDALYRHL